MNFEKTSKIEQMGKNREKLLALGKTGKYVFHGSPFAFKIAEPKQAKNKNKVTGEMENHGVPAICATEFAEQAIFRSLINEKIGPKNSDIEFGTTEEGRLYFRATENLIDIAKSGKGVVYVFDKNEFESFENSPEWRSAGPVHPIEIIEVTFEDLPHNIDIIE